jgi:mutator protein MutT
MNRGGGVPLEVACGLIFREKTLLVARRADTGFWELPGGKLEPGEGPAQCLKREIAEELATRVQVLEPFSVVEETRPSGRLRLHALLCRLAGPEPTPLEHRELRWLKPAQALALPLSPPDRRLIRRYLARTDGARP